MDFKLELAKFSCLVGLNGSGKSTVLQALDFLSRQMTGDLDGWLAERQWDKRDINSKFTRKSNIDFTVIVVDKYYGDISWNGSFNRESMKCTSEYVQARGRICLKVEDNECSTSILMDDHYSQSNQESSDREIYAVNEDSLYKDKFPIRLDYQGSILSRLRKSDIPEEALALKEIIEGIKSFDLLSPIYLHANTRVPDKNLDKVKVGLGGQRLSGYIHESGKAGKEQPSCCNSARQMLPFA